ARQTLLAGESLPVFVGLPHSYAQPVDIALSASAGLQAPPRLNIPAGQRSASVNVRAASPLQAASATLSARAQGEPAGLAPAQLRFDLQPLLVPGPVVSAVTPDSAAPGARITLTGSGFAPQPAGNTVLFGGNAAAVVHSASPTQLLVQVPALAQSGPIVVST